MSDIPALKTLRDELRRTGVLSKEFSSDLLSLGMAIASEGYERGNAIAKEAAQAEIEAAKRAAEKEIEDLKQKCAALSSALAARRCDMDELLVRAYKYDDKPHHLFSHIRVLAQKYDEDPETRKETMRLMDYAHENKGKPAPVKKTRARRTA